MKNIFKKLMAFVIICAMTLSCFIPIVNVLAETFGNGTNSITVEIENTLGFTINSVTVNGYAWENNQDEFFSQDGHYHVEIQVSGNELTGETIPRLQYGGNWNSYISGEFVGHDENDHTFILDLDYTGEHVFLGLEILEDDGSGHIPYEPHFDGHAYVLWSCGTGVCYHEFNDIPDFNDGNSTFYKDTTIKADNDESKYFDVHAQYKAWTLPDKFDLWVQAYKAHNNVEVIDWSQVDPEDIIAEFPPNMWEWEEAAVEAEEANPGTGCIRPGNEANWEEWDEFQACVDNYYIAAGNLPFIRLQPVGEPSDNNAYVSYGDRNFKVVIYNDNFKGVTTGDLTDLSYYPAHWTNPFLRTDQYDISGTTKENPALLESILLDHIVNIKALNYNGFAIKSIEALDVPDDAVTITKVDGVFKLDFASNFYDNVVFKVTDTNDGISYMKVKRYTIDAYIRFLDNEDHNPAITAEFYFARDKFYTDFDLTAKIVYKNGTTKTVQLTPCKGVDDGLGNYSDEYEVDQEESEFGLGGKGLKKSFFQYILEPGEDRDIKELYINAEYKGSTDLNYAGAYTGSGQGVEVHIEGGE